LLSLLPLLSLLLLSFSADFWSSLDEELSSLVPTAITSSLLSFSTSSSISSRLTSSPFSLVISYVFETFPFLPSFSVFSSPLASELSSFFLVSYDSDSSSSTSSVSTYVTLTFISSSIFSSSSGLILSSSSSYSYSYLFNSISSFSNKSSTVSSVVNTFYFSPPSFNSTGTADVTSISMSSSNIAISECEMSSYLENSSSSSWKNCPTVIAEVLYSSV